MELALADLISNLLVFGFKSLITDIEDFCSSVHFLTQNFFNFFSTQWNSFWSKMLCNSCEPLHQVPSCNMETARDPNTMQIADINLMMNRLGMAGWLDESANKKSLGAEDLVGLFDELEPSFEEIKETFGVFDANKDGFIDASELQRVLCNLGLKEGCCLEECRTMIKSFDCSGDGLIDFQEFVKFMEKCLC